VARPVSWVALTVGAVAVVLGGCASGNDLPAGQMDARTYDGLAATDDLGVDDVVDAGAIRDADLRQTFVAEGGPAPAAGLDCYYAETLYRRTAPSKAYRGVAQFCFTTDGTAVGVHRNRADLVRRPQPRSAE
jgi:hypothetical protein